MPPLSIRDGKRAVGSVVEHRLHTAGVTGSNPVPRTTCSRTHIRRPCRPMQQSATFQISKGVRIFLLPAARFVFHLESMRRTWFCSDRSSAGSSATIPGKPGPGLFFRAHRKRVETRSDPARSCAGPCKGRLPCRATAATQNPPPDNSGRLRQTGVRPEFQPGSGKNQNSGKNGSDTRKRRPCGTFSSVQGIKRCLPAGRPAAGKTGPQAPAVPHPDC